ncbi:MAG: hypothetical protein MK108_16590 [Mariniblastus sp.]|nr:hypothetical protein [Mariniblastus sp.]
MRYLTCALSILLLLPGLGDGHMTDAPQVTVATTGGSVIRVQPSSPSFTFHVMQPDGTTQPRDVRYDEVRELLLTDNPLANVQTEIMALVNQLGDDDFSARELAEAKLSQSQFAGRFEKMLRNFRDHPNLEVRYRIRRILASLVDDAAPPPDQDRLILKSGEHLSGDANQLQVEGEFLGSPIRLQRHQIRQLAAAPPRDLGRPAAETVRVKKFLSHAGQFYNNGDDFFFDFESDPYGNNISLSERLNDSFYAKGLLLSSDETDYVRAVRFSFKFCPLDSGSKSACVQGERMFRGVMHIRFCLPGQPGVAAGVTRFGLFIERVDHSRDFVIEALDANGNIVSLVETTDEDCCFAGFQSNIPITEVRVRQNPYLAGRTDRPLDEMYAVDNLTFDRPIGTAVPSGRSVLKLKSGDYLGLTDLQLKDGEWQIAFEESSGPIRIPIDQIAWYQAAQPTSSTPSQWRALLSDGSIIAGKMGETFQPANDGWSIEPDQIVGLWPAGKPAMYANPVDFDDQLPVLAFPGCRVLAQDFQMGQKQMRWAAASDVRLQPVRLKGREEPADEDVIAPEKSEVRYDQTEQTPTIWFQAPRTIDPADGFVTTRSGSRYVFGPTSFFQLKSISADQILLSPKSSPDFQGTELSIPLQDVSNISFGQERQRQE